MQSMETGNEVFGECENCSNMHNSWEGVVGRLRHVDMVIWMDGVFGPELTTEKRDCTVGYNFVDVHVELRSGSGLPDNKRKVVV